MLEYAGTLLTINQLKDGFSCCFSFISHIYFERLVLLVYRLLWKNFVWLQLRFLKSPSDVP